MLTTWIVALHEAIRRTYEDTDQDTYGRITSTGTTDYLIPAGLKIPELFESCGCSTASNPLIEAGPSRIRTSHLHVFSCIFKEMPLARFPSCLFTMPRQLTPHWEKTIGGTTPLRE